MPPGEKGPEDDVQLTLMDHLRELRKRLIYSAYALAIGFCIAYHYSEPIYNWIMKPFVDALGSEGKIIFTAPAEAFFLFMQVGGYASLFLVSPFIFYQFYKFVAPGLYRRERKLMMPFVVLAGLFFTLGGLFARYIILPFALDVLISSFTAGATAKEKLTAYLSVSQTLDFALMVLVAFGGIFELPLILSLLAKFGIVSSAFLTKYRRHAIVVNTIIAAIITPTGDAFNLMLMAVPLWIFYELGIIGARFMENTRATSEADWRHPNPQVQAAYVERLQYRAAEESIRVAGGLFYANACVLAVLVAEQVLYHGSHSVQPMAMAVLLVPLLLSASAGSYLRQLRPSGRTAAILLWLSQVALVVLIRAHVVPREATGLSVADPLLWAVMSTLLLTFLWRKGTGTVFSERYQREVIPKTGGALLTKPTFEDSE